MATNMIKPLRLAQLGSDLIIEVAQESEPCWQPQAYLEAIPKPP
jgi:MOSC domain-containing protein YiiM